VTNPVRSQEILRRIEYIQKLAPLQRSRVLEKEFHEAFGNRLLSIISKLNPNQKATPPELQMRSLILAVDGVAPQDREGLEVPMRTILDLILTVMR